MKTLGSLIVVSLVFFVLGRWWQTEGMGQNIDPVRLAERMVSACRRATDPAGCYARHIPATLQRGGLREAFTTIAAARERDGRFAYCHPVAEKLGSLAVRRNVKEWRRVLGSCPFATCGNGCQHAVVREIVKNYASGSLTDVVKAELSTICQPGGGWQPNTFEKSHCYLAVGSVFNYFTDANIPASLSLCDAVTAGVSGDFARLCYDGVFDQILRPMEEKDAKLVKGKAPTKETLADFCQAFREEVNGSAKKASCLNQSWALFRAEVNTPEGLERFCGQQDDPDGKESCYKILFQRIPPNKSFDMDKIADFCRQVSLGRQGMCLAAAVISLKVTDKAFSNTFGFMCDRGGTPSVQRECVRILDEYVAATEDQLFCALQ